MTRRSRSRSREWIVDGAIATVAVALIGVSGARASSEVTALERTTPVTTLVIASPRHASVGVHGGECAAALGESPPLRLVKADPPLRP